MGTTCQSRLSQFWSHLQVGRDAIPNGVGPSLLFSLQIGGEMTYDRSIVLIAAVSMLLAGAAQSAQSPQIPLKPNSIPQWVNQLPLLSLPGGAGAPTLPGTIPALLAGVNPLDFSMCEFDSNILPPGTPVTPLPPAGQGPTTRTWGYTWVATDPATGQPQKCNPRDVYLGPVVVATKGVPTEINFINNLGTVNIPTINGVANPSETQVTFYKYAIDQTLHWADPLGTASTGGNTGIAEDNACAKAGGIPAFGSNCAQNYAGPIPAVPHLHGGEVPPVLDGGPDAWWTSDWTDASGQAQPAIRGHGFYSMTNLTNTASYRYPNTQDGAPIWFHDHLLGGTRLNVYAGLAGAYLITEPGQLPFNMPSPAQIVPLVVQDRMFDTSGQLFFPGDSAGGALWSVNPEHPYWVPEFVGDTIVVNGKAWPNMNVQAKRYRVWFVNGSNARTYVMALSNNQPMYVIASDDGYLDNPVKVTTLTMMPGERYEAIIDFRGAEGKTIQLKNSGKTPFPAGVQPAASTVGRLIQFTVGACPKSGGCPVDCSYDPTVPVGTALPVACQGAYPNPPVPFVQESLRAKPIVPLTNGAGGLAAGVTVNKTRQLTLNEVLAPKSTVTDPVTGLLTNYPGGPMEILVNNTKWDGGVDANGNCTRTDFTQIVLNGVTTCYSELPNEGDTEVWEIVNTTADAHPMHTHLTSFQILNRQPYNAKNYLAAYNAAFPGGRYLPAYGPPGNYNPPVPTAPYGGNPDVTPYLSRAVRPPAPQEAGWKDTVIAYPGEVTRIVVRFAPIGSPVGATGQAAAYPFDPNVNGHGYVWHCHIVDHEDNEMMRPDIVQPLPGVTRTVVPCSHATLEQEALCF
jgi:spore coat protein A, manganese oxidase